MLKLSFLLSLFFLINACGSSVNSNENDELAERMATLTVSIPGLTTNRQGIKSTVSKRDGVPAEVTSILIEVLNDKGELLDSAEVVGTDGTVILTIVAGDNYTIRGSAFAGVELLFLGEASVASIKAGSRSSVSLTLLDQVLLSLISPGDIEIGIGATSINFNLNGLQDIALRWYVNGVSGGSAEFGFIDNSGSYITPASLPTSPVIIITAEPIVAPSFAQSFSFSLLQSDNINNDPVANAGADQSVNEQTTVSLDGTGSSDSDGSINRVSWLQISGSAVTLSDALIVSPVFTAPILIANDILIFTLTVTDNEGAMHTDTVSITVQPVNAAPVANAGVDQAVNAAVLVNLSASASADSDGSIISYSWTQISSDITPVLIDANSETPSFTAPSIQYGGFVTYRLNVTDNEGATVTDDITITVNGTDQPLVANAGLDQVVTENTQVILDGSSSNDSDNGITTYLWEELSNGGLVLSDSSDPKPVFMAPDIVNDTVYQFRLTVTNDHGDQAQDAVTVTVNNVVALANKVYFAASADFSNYTIWVSDGTDPGTQQVASITTSNFNLVDFKTIDDFFYFSGNDGVNGKELWRTDGTLAATEMFASAADASYVGEGASASADPGAFSVLADKLLYRAVVSSVNGSNRIAEYLSLDITSKNLTTVSTSGVSSFINNQVGVFNGFSYFYKKSSSPVISTTLYKTDGINSAIAVRNFLQFDDIHDFTEVNGELFFVLGSNELWKSDGTELGTVQLKLFSGLVATTGNFTGSKNMVAFNNKLYFVADDGEGRELWVSDGTVPGTLLLKDLDLTVASSNPTEFNIINGKLLFLSSEAGATTDGLWESDGTTSGTRRISSLSVNTDVGFYAGSETAVSLMVDSLNLLFFTADDGSSGHELWVTDGTLIGTKLVKDINSAGHSEPALFRQTNGFLIFSAQDSDFRAKLWKTDGTEAGTTMIKDINPGGSGNAAFFPLFG